ncbi:MAG: hypothetical protein HYR63_22910 [Proteobacteria bacterium]|nr:hypothetical protein [Pseudomonadota bacterium]MBI3497661.1 hypothetical protein [Pseudomonadota bacterium]
MLYLLAILISPLALLFAGKPLQALLNAVIWVAAWIGLLFLAPGILLWLIGVVHAVLVINAKRADQRTEKIIDALGNKPSP